MRNHSCHADRAGLLAALEPFLTDDRRRFGAIVAPLVNGLRVRGAFGPSWNGQLPYLERWRAEPRRLACMPAPVSQFLVVGGRLAEQFVHGCSQLLELGANVSDPRQLTVKTGLPPHVVNRFLASLPAPTPR